jgi:hypothetical protein
LQNILRVSYSAGYFLLFVALQISTANFGGFPLFRAAAAVMSPALLAVNLRV